jgi:hypothetical protein
MEMSCGERQGVSIKGPWVPSASAPPDLMALRSLSVSPWLLPSSKNEVGNPQPGSSSPLALGLYPMLPRI